MTYQNLCPRGSVGAIIRDSEGRYLILYRKSFPPGLAFVAGHRDGEEKPEEALVRELREEAGIKARAYELVLHDTFPNPCKSGFGGHEWWVYAVSRYEGMPALKEPDKHTFVRFMASEEVQGYVAAGDVDPAWGTFLFPALAKLPPFSNLGRNHLPE